MEDAAVRKRRAAGAFDRIDEWIVWERLEGDVALVGLVAGGARAGSARAEGKAKTSSAVASFLMASIVPLFTLDDEHEAFVTDHGRNYE